MAYDKKNRREAAKIQYKAPETPKMKEKEKLKSFIVSAKTAITDNDGVKRFPGDTIMLTEAQANHFANLGYLQLDLDFNDNEEELDALRAELAELKRAKAIAASGTAAEDAEPNADEAEVGLTADGSGGEHGDGDISPVDPQPTGEGGGRRKRVSL